MKVVWSQVVSPFSLFHFSTSSAMHPSLLKIPFILSAAWGVDVMVTPPAKEIEGERLEDGAGVMFFMGVFKVSWQIGPWLLHIMYSQFDRY